MNLTIGQKADAIVGQNRIKLDFVTPNLKGYIVGSGDNKVKVVVKDNTPYLCTCMAHSIHNLDKPCCFTEAIKKKLRGDKI